MNPLHTLRCGEPLLGCNLERPQIPFMAYLSLTVVAVVACVALADPELFQTSVLGATTSLWTSVHQPLSTTAGLQTSVQNIRGQPRPLRQGVNGQQLSHLGSSQSTTALNNVPETEPNLAGPSTDKRTVRQIAGFGLAAVVATALTLMNRLRPRKTAAAFSTSSYVGPVASAEGAVLDAPVAPVELEQRPGVQGVVSAEESINLPFTLSQLRDAIPEKCLEKSLFWSMFYCLRDWGIVGALYYFQPAFFGLGLLGKFAWVNAVGFYGWCLFVVGHDCGHGSFSNYGWINQLIGHICHAPLMVPFNAWRISHRHHHQYHNDVDRDHSWRPSVAGNVNKLSGPIKFFRFSPLILLVYPFYLLSPSQENGFSGCHFWPWNPLFKEEERVGVGMSALSVVAWAGAIAAATVKFGWMAVTMNYWIPYWIFVMWLDLVTLMQHTDDHVLYFRGAAWNYLRGAVSTVDRTYRHFIDPLNLGYGRVIDHLHHNISDGHVIHHLFFTQIPHYRLMAATEALKPIMGKHYRFDETPVPLAFMRTLGKCWFVEDEGGVVAYKGADEYKDWEDSQTAMA